MLSFALEFVPYAGPVLASAPGIIAGFAVSPGSALKALVHLAVHFVEGYILQPIIMERAIRIQPVWQLAMGSAFGLLGIFVAW